MIEATKRVAVGAALLALGGITVACGDDDGGTGGTDAGVMDAGRDAGQDAGAGDDDAGGGDDDGGAGDAGQDAGPPPPNLRLAHLIPGAPDVHVCIHATVATTSRLITVNPMTGMAIPVPYRGVSNYTDRLTLPAVPHVVRVYDADELGTDATCPAPGATDPMPIIVQQIDIGELMGGAHYTVAAIGLGDGTGAQAPQLAIIRDDLSDPEDGNAKVRLVHALPNLPAPVDVCHDPDFAIVGGVPMPGDEPAVALFENESFIGADPAETGVQTIEYIESDPITGGFIFVYLRGATATDCATADPFTTPGTLRIPVPLPVPPAGTPGVPGALSAGATLDAGEIVSVFAIGDATFATVGAPTACTTDADCSGALPAGHVCNLGLGVCVHPLGPTALPYVDNFTE